MASSRSRPWAGWALRVGLPSVALLGVASVVPSEDVWARTAAQLAAVLVPLGLETVRSRWARRHDQELSRDTLRARLDALSESAPAGLRMGLDDPAYRVTPYWGRAAVHHRLDAARAGSCPGVIVVTGAAWTGKTRLLTEWALDLPDDVVAGWLRPGTAAETIEEAKSLGSPVVMLQQGDDDGETIRALAALAGVDRPITLVIEKRDASRLFEAARAVSPGAGRILETAEEVAVVSPGRSSDLEHRYGEMVSAYGKVTGTWESAQQPRSGRTWKNEPIGLVSVLAMLHALGGAAGKTGLSPMESLGRYWTALIAPWLRQRPAAGFGLPPLSDVQLETAVVVDLLTDGRAAAVLERLAMLEKLGAHEIGQLVGWAQEVTKLVHTALTGLAAVAATEAWTESQREAVGVALRAGSRPGLAQVIRHCVVAEQVLNERPALIQAVLATDVDSVHAALDALASEIVTRPVDHLLAERVTSAPFAADDAEGLLTKAAFERLPQTHVALLQRQLDDLPPDYPAEQRAELAFNLANRFVEVGRAREALPPAEEAVNLYRRLADPVTGNPERFDAVRMKSERLRLELRLSIAETDRPDRKRDDSTRV